MAGSTVKKFLFSVMLLTVMFALCICFLHGIK